MDGKHVMLQAPIHTGSDYFNYKGFFSIVLLALVDANDCFSYVSVGCQGRLSDGGVFANSALNEFLESNTINLPNATPLPGRTLPVPYVIVADDAFPLKPTIMKTYPGLHEKGSEKRVFNYRHCRCRRVVENAFGIISVVFRVLRKPLLLEPDRAQKVVLACIHLHNFLRRSKSSNGTYTPSGTFDQEDPSTGQLIPGQWRVVGLPSENLLRLKKIPKKSSDIAKLVRNEFCAYLNSPEGSVPWQKKY
nr:uncharacterized protein LOC111504497 [Leptinotarsa decemlineata]